MQLATLANVFNV